MSLHIGDTVPDIETPATGGRTLKPSDFRGQNLVLYFYPKASTPGCTQEGQDFRDAAASFAAANTVILGASRDGLKAQENFKAKQGFPFDLLSDTEEALCRAYELVARRHNELGIGDPVDPTVRPYYSRPFRVIGGERFADACRTRIEDPWLAAQPLIGGIDQVSDSTDVLSYPVRAHKLKIPWDDA